MIPLDPSSPLLSQRSGSNHPNSSLRFLCGSRYARSPTRLITRRPINGRHRPINPPSQNKRIQMGDQSTIFYFPILSLPFAYSFAVDLFSPPLRRRRGEKRRRWSLFLLRIPLDLFSSPFARSLTLFADGAFGDRCADDRESAAPGQGGFLPSRSPREPSPSSHRYWIFSWILNSVPRVCSIVDLVPPLLGR